MKNPILLVIIVVLVVAVAGWYAWSRPRIVTREVQVAVTPTAALSPTTTPPPAVAAKTVELTQIDASGQKGTATFTPEGDKTKVTLSMIGKKYSSLQPAHIHVGKCPQPGAVKYPLSSVVDGKSQTVISVKMADLFAMLPLAVNVHKSAEEASVYTACGDLQ